VCVNSRLAPLKDQCLNDLKHATSVEKRRANASRVAAIPNTAKVVLEPQLVS
jgi:hypothetical protein